MFANIARQASLRPSLLLTRPARGFAQRLITDDARAKIASAVKAHKVVVFMKGNPEQPRCGFSRAVAQVLAMYEIPPKNFQSYDVLQDEELRSSIKEYSEWPTIPQLYVEGEFVGGCDIVLDMHKTGGLEELLENSGAIPKTVLEQEAAKTA